jgi:ADP-ribose pyrophosphatase YjhB (NUDIX family)
MITQANMSKKERPFTPEQFQEIYSKVPRITVEIAIKNELGIVMTQRKEASWQNLWHIPGCTLYYQESIDHAIIRLAQEELGITVINHGFLQYLEYFSETQYRGYGSTIGLVFLCTTNDELPQENEAGETVAIFSHIPQQIVPEHRIILEKLLS